MHSCDIIIIFLLISKLYIAIYSYITLGTLVPDSRIDMKTMATEFFTLQNTLKINFKLIKAD